MVVNYTMEAEKDGMLPFFDTKLSRRKVYVGETKRRLEMRVKESTGMYAQKGIPGSLPSQSINGISNTNYTGIG